LTKRNPGKFERKDDDFYPTVSLVAVRSLLPHLRGVKTFAEPCCGDGALVRALESAGLRCVYQGDKKTGQDALACNHYGGADLIVTNPPYERERMHPLITHFARIVPTWLLLEQDWCATKQAVPYLAACTDIVAIGRLNWIAGTKSCGFDNFAWCRFDARHTAGRPIFHPFRSAPAAPRITRVCECGKTYEPQRSSSQFCSHACRQRAYRERLSTGRSLSVTFSVTHDPLPFLRTKRGRP
jgi:hypothetical protein